MARILTLTCLGHKWQEGQLPSHYRQTPGNTMGTMSERPSIGWIGTGVMGAPMAGHLLDAGYDAHRLQPHRARGPMTWWRVARGAPTARPGRPRMLTSS